MTTITNNFLLPRVLRIVCVVLAATFVASGLAKLLNFSETVMYFLGFGFIKSFFALWLASFLISLEITLGMALLFERNPVKPLLLCSGMMLVFTIYQIVVILFPATFIKTCPCFGASAPISGMDLLPLARNILLLLLAGFSYVFCRRQSSGSPNCDLPN